MIDEVKAFIELTKAQLHSVLALILGILLIIGGFVFIDDFLNKFIAQEFYRGLFYLLTIIIWSVFWAYHKFHIPKNKKNKLGIVIAIFAENEIERQKLKLDFVSELKNNLRQEGILEISNIIFLKNHQAEDIVESNNFSEAIAQVNKKIKGHFYVWGKIKKRPDQDSDHKYYLSFNGYVVHKPIRQELSSEISKDFSAVLPKEISFLEREFKGFEASAKIVHLATKYIVGIAAFVSDDPELAFKLHNGLREQFNSFRPIPPNLQNIRNKLPILLSQEALWLARWYYTKKQDAVKTKEFFNIAIKENSKNYGVWLFKAILDFQSKEIYSAIKSIKKAKELASGQLEWRYSEAFLYFWVGNYFKALKVCKKIKDQNYSGEVQTLTEVRAFNLSLLTENKKPQLYFWIGYLSYFKNKNLGQALLDFEKFEELADDSMSDLTTKSNIYIKQIKKEMQIDNQSQND